MASVSEVKAGLVNIAQAISTGINRVQTVRSELEAAKTDLQSIPTTYADVKDTIEAYTPTGEFETLCQDELDKLIAEYLALVSDITDAITAIENV